MFDISSGKKDPVSRIAPAILPRASVGRRARDAVPAPVVRPHPAIAALDPAPQQPLQERRSFADERPQGRPMGRERVLDSLPCLSRDIWLVMIRFDDLFMGGT